MIWKGRNAVVIFARSLIHMRIVSKFKDWDFLQNTIRIERAFTSNKISRNTFLAMISRFSQDPALVDTACKSERICLYVFGSDPMLIMNECMADMQSIAIQNLLSAIPGWQWPIMTLDTVLPPLFLNCLSHVQGCSLFRQRRHRQQALSSKKRDDLSDTSQFPESRMQDHMGVAFQLSLEYY
jgi:hypothetical protein